jgi:membrane-bound lytic murein transglycosylase D
VVSAEELRADTGLAKSDGALPIETASGIGADPGDYEVAQDNTIEVAIGETLGHYAEWLETHSGEIRQLNRLRQGQRIMMGQRIRLAFHKTRPEVFEQRRLAYHEHLQSDYFERYRIVGACSHTLRKGDSLWQIAKQEYGIPLWLLRQYNPDVDTNEVLTQGVSLLVPIVAPLEETGDATGENTTAGRGTCPGSSLPVLSSIPRGTPVPQFTSTAGQMRVERI